MPQGVKIGDVVRNGRQRKPGKNVPRFQAEKSSGKSSAISNQERESFQTGRIKQNNMEGKPANHGAPGAPDQHSKII
jgi:hypothetical protein